MNKKMQNITLIISDIDGVLTDGRINLIGNTEEMKSFSAKDGPAIEIAKKNGIRVIFYTGRTSSASERRAKELNVPLYYKKDGRELAQILEKDFMTSMGNVAYVGDDFNDLRNIKNSAVSFAPSDSNPIVRKYASITTEAKGGEGVLIEVVRTVLTAQGKWEGVIEQFLSEEKTHAQ